MIDFETAKAVGGIIGGTLATVWGVLFARQKLKRGISRDRADNKADDVEVDMLERALQEGERQRNRADEAFTERNAAMLELGELRGKVRELERHRDECDRRLVQYDERANRMELQIQAMRELIHKLVQEGPR